MRFVLTLISIWGVADSLWLATRPRDWASFWSRIVRQIGSGQTLPRAVAAVELLLSLALLLRRRER